LISGHRWDPYRSDSVSVKDNGLGIAPESLVGIFEIFSQVHNAAGRSDGGLGIGLAAGEGPHRTCN
jgi:signal transduction histidine kinase